MLHVTKLTFVHKVSLQHYSTHAATGRYANQKLVIDQVPHSASNCKEVYGAPNTCRLDSSGQTDMASQKMRVWVNQLFQHTLHMPTGKNPPLLFPRSAPALSIWTQSLVRTLPSTAVTDHMTQSLILQRQEG